MQQKWWTLTAVGVAIFMLLLDITIVNVALPDIQRELGASFSDLQWVVDAYALTLASLLLVSGSLADLLGRRLIFLIGLASSRSRRSPAGWPRPRPSSPSRAPSRASAGP